MKPPRRRWAAVLVVVLSTLVAGPVTAGVPSSHQAGDEDVSVEEFRQLAARAVEDPAALAELRRVESVDGQPIDVEALLAGTSRPELGSRLRQLAGSDAVGPEEAGPVSADRARDRAEDVLDRDKYQPTDLPRPFEGILRWIGDRLEPVIGPVGRFLERVVEDPRGAIGVAVAVVVLAALVARSVIGRRSRAAVAAAGSGAVGGSSHDDPGALEAAAADAEAAGRLEPALRLRFRAGLLRLDRAGAVAYRPSLTAGEVGRGLRSPTFDRLARGFDEVVYGGRPADTADVEEAKRDWSELLAEAGGRRPR